MFQPTTARGVQAALERHGLAQGAADIMTIEREAAASALRSGLYVTYRSAGRTEDCSRVGPRSRCFCGCIYANHKKTRQSSGCNKCKCKSFRFVPQRPEEVGDWHLPRRKGFNVRTWRAKCRCGCAHDVHDAVTLACSACRCPAFQSNFACIACDKKWEDHSTVFESKDDRRRGGMSFGRKFVPLAEHPQMQRMVFLRSSCVTTTR